MDKEVPQPRHEQMQVRIDKLEAMEAQGVYPFACTKARVDVSHQELLDRFEELEGQHFHLAGRIMSKRGMGKVSFVDLQDRSGRMQLFTKIDALGEEAYEAWQSLDLGDFIAVEGELFRTRRGEISIRTTRYRLLAKALRPLPEKFHGITDTDTRYRKRYLDLIVNPDVRETFAKRSKIISVIRHSLEDDGFMEVETPILNQVAGGAAARPFSTHHNALDIDLFLRISPELYLKRLIVGGFERVFEIGRNFRNEGLSTRHNPEFTMIEIYQAYADYHDMMALSEKLISQACEAVNGSMQIRYKDVDLDLRPPFKRQTMRDCILEHTGVDFEAIEDREAAKAAADEAGIEGVSAQMQRGDIMNLFFEQACEDKLIQPTFIYDYPIEISPLTKKKPGCEQMVERFEIFILGMEYGNAYSELNDPRDQRERFQAQMDRRAAGDVEANMADLDYVEALEHGLPPTGGLGIGIDRLVMLLCGETSIRDVLLFPTMKPLPPR